MLEVWLVLVELMLNRVIFGVMDVSCCVSVIEVLVVLVVKLSSMS